LNLSSERRTEIVKDYMATFPDTPTLTLAKKIYKENCRSFSTLESARSMIRYWRGQHGDVNRKNATEKDFFKEPGALNPFEKIPEGLTTLDDWKPIPIHGEKVLRLCDAHIPYHDREALITALKFGKQERVDTIIMDDFIDFFALSFWEKDPDKRDLGKELETTKQIFGIIRGEFPDAKMILKKGNHEARYDRYMRVKAPELLSVKDFRFREIIDAKSFDIDVVDDKSILTVADLHIVHGHEFGRTIFSPVNPARGLWLRAKAHCICGHFHQPSYHPEKNIAGKVAGCWSVGCLCDMHPDYSPLNKWSHGCAVIYRTGTKNFRVKNKTIIDGELY
jgi:predicted phosphodiesterase